VNIKHNQHRRSDVLRVSGRIDSSNAQQFQDELMRVLREGSGNIVVNMKSLEYISSAGLRALIAALKETRGKTVGKGNVVLAEVPPRIREVFDLAVLGTLFTFYDDETQAVGSF
jgi:anti-sigma B factor antagonist